MKKLRLISAIVLLTMVLAAPISVLASTITGALYSGVVVVSNNSTASSNVATVMTLDTANMISQGWINSGLTNVAVQNDTGADVPFMPSVNSTVPWAFWVPTINANSNLNYQMYTGGGDMSSTKYYFPGAGGMTVPDNATLEPGDNFTLSVSGYFDTDNGTSKNIIDKTDALKVFVSPTVSGNITATIYAGALTTDYLLPDGAGAYTGIGGQFPASTSHYDKVDDPVATPDDATTYVFVGVTTGQKDAYSLSNLSVANITAVDDVVVTVYYRTWMNTLAGSITPYLRLADGTETTGTTQVLVDDSVWTNYNQVLTRPGGGTWTPSDLNNLQVAANLTKTVNGEVHLTQIYVEVVYTPIYARVSATGVTSGKHDLTISETPTATFNGTNYFYEQTSNYRLADNIGTIAAWFKTSNSTQSAIFTSSNEPAGEVMIFGLLTDVIYVNVTSPVNGGVKGSTIITDDKWHLGVWQSDGTDYILYTDNANLEILTPLAAGNTGNWFIDVNNRNNALIGALYQAVSSVLFDGTIGEVLVYNVVLTPAQISNIYFGNVPTTNLVSRYRLDEGSGTIVHDSIDATWDLTGVGAPDLTSSVLRLNIDNNKLSISDGVDVPNTTANWTFAQNNVMPYVETANVTVGGNLAGSWKWNYPTDTTAPTFPDDSVNSNTATPSFRLSSSDADVSASLSTFAPIDLATAPAFTVSAAPDFVSSNITASANFTSGNITSSGIPGATVIDDSAANAGVPNIWLWGIIGGITIVLGGAFISWMEREHGSGGGTIFIRLSWAILVISLLVTFNIFDFWMIPMYLFIALAPAMASMQRDIGASLSQLNLIAFLSMVWVGLTMIGRITEGSLITAAETSHLNNFMFTQEFKLLDIFPMPIMNFDFFTVGIPSLLKWDYAFFGGNAQIIQYMLYSINAVMGFIVLLVVVGLTSSYFTRRGI